MATKEKASLKPEQVKKPRVKFKLDRKNPPDFLSTQQFADVFGVATSTVYAWIRNKDIDAMELPPTDPDADQTFWRIPTSEVFRLESRNTKSKSLEASTK